MSLSKDGSRLLGYTKNIELKNADGWETYSLRIQDLAIMFSLTKAFDAPVTTTEQKAEDEGKVMVHTSKNVLDSTDPASATPNEVLDIKDSHFDNYLTNLSTRTRRTGNWLTHWCP